MTQVREENTGEYLCEFGVGRDSLNSIYKELTLKDNSDKLEYVEIKNFSLKGSRKARQIVALIRLTVDF